LAPDVENHDPNRILLAFNAFYFLDPMALFYRMIDTGPPGKIRIVCDQHAGWKKQRKERNKAQYFLHGPSL
jgi:hypothetical protein